MNGLRNTINPYAFEIVKTRIDYTPTTIYYMPTGAPRRSRADDLATFFTKDLDQPV